MRGQCLCGDVAWDVEGPFRWLSHCHCSMCRKSHGTAFATYVFATETNVRRASEPKHLRSYESSPGFDRPFCGLCGSAVLGAARDGQVAMPAGSLDGDLGVEVFGHIFVASMAPWHEITDDLPRFDAYPEGMGTSEIAHPARAPGGEIRGSCLCDAVAYEISRPQALLIDCHCSRCRRARGAAHASNLIVAPDEFRWLRGEERTRFYKLPEARRFGQAFCGDCGSPMPRVDPVRIVLPAGSLDVDPGARARFHIYTGSKAAWFAISDDLPQFAEGPPG